MTVADVNALVESIGLPCSYYQFPDGTGQQPPFVCWFFLDSRDFYADNTNFQPIRPLAIELYTNTRDFDTEARVEAALTGAGLAYSLAPGWVDDERMHISIYNTEVLING